MLDSFERISGRGLKVESELLPHGLQATAYNTVQALTQSASCKLARPATQRHFFTKAARTHLRVLSSTLHFRYIRIS
ncbi:MAG: hypothetical protein WCY08_00440 [Rhodocyclaceae bacterium]